MLRDAACDVAVLVAREEVTGRRRDPTTRWWSRSAAPSTTGPRSSSAPGSPPRPDAPLKTARRAGDTEERSRVTRLLGDAGLLVQQYAGIPAEPIVAEPGREGILAAAEGAGLLVIGLSERWRRRASARRGPRSPGRAAPRSCSSAAALRPGALAPRDDVTRFTWSSANVGGETGSGVDPTPV